MASNPERVDALEQHIRRLLTPDEYRDVVQKLVGGLEALHTLRTRVPEAFDSPLLSDVGERALSDLIDELRLAPSAGRRRMLKMVGFRKERG